MIFYLKKKKLVKLSSQISLNLRPKYQAIQKKHNSSFWFPFKTRPVHRGTYTQRGVLKGHLFLGVWEN